jgi:hypothetical protein
MIISRATPVPQVDGKKPYTTGWNTNKKKVSSKTRFFVVTGGSIFSSLVISKGGKKGL